MDIIAWIIILALFIVAFIGLVYPIIPSVLFLLGGFIAYGLFYKFSDLPWWFWVIEILFVALLFVVVFLAATFFSSFTSFFAAINYSSRKH